jgi:tetratricopeptide (TPR) repeat protein
MTLSDNDLAAIDGYFKQSLSDKDKQAFEHRLATEPAFRQAVQEYQAVVAVVNTVQEREQKARLSQIDATMPPFETPVRRLNYWWAAAASALVLVGGSLWLMNRDHDMIQLKAPVTDYFEPFPALGITQGNEAKEMRNVALRTYAVSDFKKAIPLLEQSFQMQADSLLLFYKGLALLGNGQAVQAEQVLKTLHPSENVPKETIDWYLALTYVQLENRDKAIILLKKVANTEGGYQTKAKELLAKL